MNFLSSHNTEVAQVVEICSLDDNDPFIPHRHGEAWGQSIISHDYDLVLFQQSKIICHRKKAMLYDEGWLCECVTGSEVVNCYHKLVITGMTYL